MIVGKEPSPRLGRCMRPLDSLFSISTYETATRFQNQDGPQNAPKWTCTVFSERAPCGCRHSPLTYRSGFRFQLRERPEALRLRPRKPWHMMARRKLYVGIVLKSQRLQPIFSFIGFGGIGT